MALGGNGMTYPEVRIGMLGGENPIFQQGTMHNYGLTLTNNTGQEWTYSFSVGSDMWAPTSYWNPLEKVVTVAPGHVHWESRLVGAGAGAGTYEVVLSVVETTTNTLLLDNQVIDTVTIVTGPAVEPDVEYSLVWD